MGLRVLGALLGWLAGSVLRIRRAHVEASMRAAGVDAPSRQARAMYASLGTSAVEFLWMAAARRSAVRRAVEFDEASHAAWSDVVGQGRGVVVAASHTGNWDLAACAIAQDVELLVVTKHLHVRWLDAFWQSTRARLGVTLSDADGALARARAVLRRGGVVAMMIDQVPLLPRHASPVEFLGRLAATDRAPAALAASARVPLVVAAARREGRRQVLQVLEVLHPPPRGARGGSRARGWVLHATRSATWALDRFVRAHPREWLWLHRRWKPLGALAHPVDDPPSGAMLGGTSPCTKTPSLAPSSTPSSSPAAASAAGSS